MSRSLSVLFYEYCVDLSWDFTHWTCHCICLVIECRSFDEQGKGKEVLDDYL
ncbi:hypothetical protein Scep_004816 [Stephania cephalantha]|uniref:Uncharacterized protein n=1 Tax=Stephania cephalantha TaxID=152367 RepID=A0AAP0PVR9_9MAGN